MKTIMTALTLVIFLSCKNNNSDTYNVNDFDKKLQPHLTKIISCGVVDVEHEAQRFVEKNISKKDLSKLCRAESPLLRAFALEAILKDSANKHPDFLFQYMSDTAFILVNEGEWGYRMKTVSDYILSNYTRFHREMIDTLETEAILKHNYLAFAYLHLPGKTITDTFYSSIKQMALRENPYDEFRMTEDALYSLALYEKKEDIPFIKQVLLEHIPYLSEVSFSLMSAFPNESYVELLTEYYRREFFSKLMKGGGEYDKLWAFQKTLANYKDPKCTEILKQITNEQFIKDRIIKASRYYFKALQSGPVN